MDIRPISVEATKPWIIKKHYAHCMPIVLKSFGLFNDNNIIEGIVAYGVPVNRRYNMSACVFGGDLEIECFELQRLCIQSDDSNAASILVGRSLKFFNNPTVIVSFADCNQGHVGYVYQATNWIYCGVTNSKNRFVKNGKDLHTRTIFSRYGTNKMELLPENISVSKQKGKHRYLYFVGTKKQKKQMLSLLKFDVLPYPKGESSRYEIKRDKQILTPLSVRRLNRK